MSKIIYNKLVRDRIPEIISAAGKTYETSIMDPERYEKALMEKIIEEATELVNAPPDERIKEISDLYEVIQAIQLFWGVEDGVVDENQQKRVRERGAFKNRIELHWVEE